MKENVSTTNDYAHRLLLSNFLREPAICSAIHSLQLPSGSQGLDVGCGIGLHTPLLAQAVGPSGRVIGLDLSPEFLCLAKARAEKFSLSAQMTFQEGDMTHLPFEDNKFDWVWSADTVHPGLLNDPLSAVREFIRVVKPGGQVVILYWSSQKLLPGHALLEALLDSAFAETVPYMSEIRPELHFMRAMGWLRDAGLDELSACTFVADVQAPLSEYVRSVLTMIFQMFWGDLQSSVAPDAWAEFERLCRPASPDCLLYRHDYYAFLTYSLFRGKVVKQVTQE